MTRAITALTLAAALAAGCSGDDDSGSSTTTGDVVAGDNAAPTVNILKPRDGAVVAANEPIIFSASVSDDHDAADALTVLWTSDLLADPLSDVPANSLGTVTFEYPGLEPGEHVITVGATDGGGKTGSDFIAITVNAAPTAPEVAITPLSPTTADNLVATLSREATDPDRASSALDYSYRWFEGGTFANVTTDTVPADVTAKGQVWEVRVTALDGLAESAEATATVTVGNSPPSCNAASVFPSGGDTTTAFDCVCTGWRDPDGDAAADRCAFFDGVAPIPGDGGCALPADRTAKGMEIVCEYTPSDGEDDGEPQTSSAVPVQNAPPTAPEAALSPAVADATTELTCTLASPSTDPDEDSLSYAVGWLVDGYLNPELSLSTVVASGLKTATNTPARRGSRVSCQLVASDATANSAPGVSAELILGNAPPALGEVVVQAQGGATRIDETTVLLCVVSDTSDADGDSMSLGYAWFVDGEEVSGVNGGALTGAHFDRGDAVSCAITADDGQGGAAGPKTSKDAVAIGNALPSLVGAVITPSQPSPYDLLTCTPQGWFDPDGDPLEAAYAWYTVDGSGALTPIVGVSGGTLTASSYTAGTQIVCEATPKNGIEAGQTVQSAPVALVAPSATAPVVEVNAPTGADGAVRCDFVQPAQHFAEAVSYTYFWTINGGVETSGGASLTGLSDCDLVACRAVASDGATTLSSEAAELLLPVGDDCATGNVCRTPTCEPGGGCNFLLASDIGCDDGAPCTSDDHCELGFCVAGGVADEGTACEDGLYCTGDDSCDGAGGCVGGESPCASDPGSCLASSCDEVDDSCIVDYKDADTPCSDGDGCTVGDRCSANGVCLPGATPDCSSAGDGCTAGVCESLSATDHHCVGEPKATGVACDSDDVCLDNATCDGLGNCTGGDTRDCVAETGDDCNGAYCDPTKPRDQACRPTPLPTGTACDDDDVCTLTDTCSNGFCVGSGNACVEEQVNASLRANQQPSVLSLGFGRYVTQWWGQDSTSAQYRLSDALGSRENEQSALTSSGRPATWSSRMATRPGGDVAIPYHRGNTRVNAVSPCNSYRNESSGADLGGRGLSSAGELLVDNPMVDISANAYICSNGYAETTYGRFLTLPLLTNQFGFVGMVDLSWGGYAVSGTPYTGLARRTIWYIPPTDFMTVGTPVQLVPAGEVANGDYWDARMTADGTGTFVVAWADVAKTSIKARRYQSTGQPAAGSTLPWTLQTADAGETFGDVRIIGQADSNLVLVFEVSEGDGDGVGVYLQRYDSEGNTLGGTSRVNAQTTGDQRLGEVALFSDDGFIVAFDDQDGDSDGWAVKTRRYSGNGTTQGGVLNVNVYTSGAQYHPTVAVLDGDDYVVAFIDDQGRVWTRRYAQDGTPAMGQVERRLNATTAGGQRAVRAAATATGAVFAVYESPVYGKQDGEILGRLIDPQGPTLAAEQQVNDYDIAVQRNPAVAGGQGHFAVTWQSTEQDGSGEGVYGRFFDDAGVAVTDELQVNATADGFQRNPAVAMTSGDAGFFVWGGQTGNGSIADVFGRVLAVDGTPLSGDFVINDVTEGIQDQPAVAADDTGNVFVAWQSAASDGTGFNIHGRKLDDQGIPQAASVMINTSVDQDQTKVDIAVSADGSRVTACWESLSQDAEGSLGVYCQVMDADLAKIASEVRVNEMVSGEQRNVVVRYLSSGSILVGWDSENVDSESFAVQYRRLSNVGLPFGPRIVANRTWAGSQAKIELVPLSGSGLIALWQSEDQDGDDTGIFFRDLSTF